MKTVFNPVLFGKRIKMLLEYHDLDTRSAAKQIGVSHSTVSRMCNGKPPDIENYLRTMAWIEKKEQIVRRPRRTP